MGQMREYVTELSRYALPLLMGIYALCGFLCLTDRLEKKGFIYVIQNLLLFTIQMLMFLDLALVSKNADYAFLYLFVQVFLLAVVLVVPLIYERANRLLLNNMGMLMGIGLCVISRISFQRAVKQYVIALIALIVSMFIPWLMLQIRFWKKLTWVYGFIGLLLLGAVFVLGDVTRGSMLTIELWKVSFQPSELVKLIFVFFLAGALWDSASFRRVAATALVAGAYVITLVVAKDLGSALIFFVTYVFVVVAATRNWLYLLAGTVGGGGAAYVAYQLFAHVRTRVLAWRDPWTYIDFQGYAITQSLFAIGSGNWFGMGLLKGNPGAIPFVEEDFTFSAVCEELGVAFGIGGLLVMLTSFFAMMKMASRIRDRFYQTIVYGIGIMYVFQIFLTVGGGIRLIPLTGVTLPFVSYGGSSLMVTMMMFFIVQGIYMRLQQEGERYNARVAGQNAEYAQAGGGRIAPRGNGRPGTVQGMGTGGRPAAPRAADPGKAAAGASGIRGTVSGSTGSGGTSSGSAGARRSAPRGAGGEGNPSAEGRGPGRGFGDGVPRGTYRAGEAGRKKDDSRAGKAGSRHRP